LERYNYIAVEGAIGSGKTILVEALAQRLGAEKIELSPEENPFLQDFYRNPERFAFQTQLFFLLERHKLMLRLFEIDLFHQVVVSDFVFERDRLYASLILSSAEFKLYSQIERFLNRELPKPQLVVYLQAPVDLLVREIHMRGRPFERKYITEEFIAHLVQGYNEFFFNWSATPLLIVDRSTVDIHNTKQLESLVEYITTRRISGHQYYSESTLF